MYVRGRFIDVVEHVLDMILVHLEELFFHQSGWIHVVPEAIAKPPGQQHPDDDAHDFIHGFLAVFLRQLVVAHVVLYQLPEVFRGVDWLDGLFFRWGNRGRNGLILRRRWKRPHVAGIYGIRWDGIRTPIV